MSTVIKSPTASLATSLPSNNHRIGPIGTVPGSRVSGTSEKIMPCDFVTIASDGTVRRAIMDQANSASAINDVQTMYLNGDPQFMNGGTYVLGYKGVFTPAFTVGNDGGNAAVQTVMQALSTIGTGNLTVSGNFPNYVFTGAGTLAGVELDLIQVDSTILTSGTQFLTLGINHTTVGQPAGTGNAMGSSRVRGVYVNNGPAYAGEPITPYDACILNYSDGNLTPNQDLYLSGTVPGGLDTVATLTGQQPVAFALDTQRIYVFAIK